MKTKEILTPEAARKLGFWALTTPYLPSQSRWKDNVISDLNRSDPPIDFCIVRRPKRRGVEIWRTEQKRKS